MELWYRTVRSMTLHSSDYGNVGWKRLKLHYHEISMGKFSKVQPCCKNVVLMLEILRTGFSRSIYAACSGMLVQGGFIPRFCCNKFFACLSYISLPLKRIIMETQGRFLWR